VGGTGRGVEVDGSVGVVAGAQAERAMDKATNTLRQIKKIRFLVENIYSSFEFLLMNQ